MSDSSLISGERVIVETESAIHIGPVETAPSSAKIELIKSGDEIRYIEITCDCGKKTRIACEY